MKEEMVLCGAAGRQQKFYFNPRYEKLPETVKQELKAALSLFAERVGGTILLVFEEEGNLTIRLMPDEDDFSYDEIEAGLAVSRLQKEKEALFLQLEMFYRGFFGGVR